MPLAGKKDPKLPIVICSGKCRHRSRRVVDFLKCVQKGRMDVGWHSSKCGSTGRSTMVWLALLLAGCVNTSPQARMSGWRTIDSPGPLGAADDYQARRIAPGTASRKDPVRPHADGSLPLPKTAESSESEPDPDEPPAIVRDEVENLKAPPKKSDSAPSIESIPRIEPDEVTVGRPLELTVTAPGRKAPGGAATYRVTLRNTSDHPLESLMVRCQFDEALVFSGSDRREVVRRIERLSAGESKEMALSLTSDKVGAHCCWFVVSRTENGSDVEMVSRQVCVEFVTRHVEIDVVGPLQRTEGSRAEFNITLFNNSLKTINDSQAIVSFDKALVPREASAEAERKAGALAWRLGSLHPMEKIQLQVEFECRAQAHRACIAVDVKGANLAAEHEEACLEIVPVPGTLDLRVSDRDDPLETGKTGAYEVTVHNVGLQAARRVVLEAALPDNVRFRSATVRSSDAVLPVKSELQGNKLLFDAIDQLEPNARLDYIIEFEATRAGSAEFHASLTSSLGGTAVTAAEPTTIVEP
jgi:uncharacterized repeat protein (TIGR01451 family)